LNPAPPDFFFNGLPNEEGHSMRNGFTEKEAKKLVGQSFVTHAPFSGIPLRTRGVVTEALNSQDHWNVMIDWVLPGTPHRGWYNKHELQAYMRLVTVTSD
jgi:hypothetical protein